MLLCVSASYLELVDVFFNSSTPFGTLSTPTNYISAVPVTGTTSHKVPLVASCKNNTC